MQIYNTKTLNTITYSIYVYRWMYIVCHLQESLNLHGKTPIDALIFVYRMIFGSKGLKKALSHFPLEEADAICCDGKKVQFFQDMIRNPTGLEPYWHNKNILCDFDFNESFNESFNGLNKSDISNGNSNNNDKTYNNNNNNNDIPPVHIIAGWYDFFLEQSLLDYTALSGHGDNDR